MVSRLLIRADASPRMGTGHVMRCLALAQGWRRAGGEVQFACAEITPSLESRLRSDGFPVHHVAAQPGSISDAEQTIHLLRNSSTPPFRHPSSDLGSPISDLSSRSSDPRPQPSAPRPWLVADGYHFGAEFQHAIKEASLRLLIVDDYGHADHYFADIVLNQNLSARADLYASREPYTRLLLGTRYVLLREQFLAHKHWQRETPAVARKVLVTLGGADPDNVTGKVVDALRGLDVDAKIVVGGSNPHLARLRAELRATTSDLRPHTSSLHLVVDTQVMPSLMAWADVAVTAGGSTSWELAFMGLPSMAVVLSDNQRGVVESMARGGVSVDLGPAADADSTQIAAAAQNLLTDSPRRRSMSRLAREMVDGFGADRVVTLIRAAEMKLRQASEEDSRLIWEWASDPEVRAKSFTHGPIPWEEHQRWFGGKIHDPKCLFYMGVDDAGNAVGQIRFEETAGEVVVSVNLDRNWRGKGYGAALISAGGRRFLQGSDATAIHAYIKPGNSASVRAFQKADFFDAGVVEIGGQAARHFVLQKASV